MIRFDEDASSSGILGAAITKFVRNTHQICAIARNNVRQGATNPKEFLFRCNLYTSEFSKMHQLLPQSVNFSCKLSRLVGIIQQNLQKINPQSLSESRFQ